MSRTLPFLALTMVVAAVLPPPTAGQVTSADAEASIENALGAAPPAIAADAAVMDWEGNELRAGSNGWTCFPDPPHSPGNDPMCLDAAWVAWAGAWQDHTTPEITRVGLAYMLRGGSDASNTDPFATEPPAGQDWVDTGPHVMVIVPDPAQLEGIPTDPANGGPYVMWKGTPYAHIMVPVAGPGMDGSGDGGDAQRR